ncbi:MAG: type II secretion system F family protein [Magnetococcales bacterium]|nr:type II secretion system F family protein [Magnetococcales bacterium]
MPSYLYKAAGVSGRISQGSMDAANVDDLELRLERLGLILIQCRDASKTPTSRLPWKKNSPVNRSELILFCFHMEQLSRAGVSLLSGLEALAKNMDNPRFREILTSIGEDMQGGKQLSQAMQAHSSVFDPVFINLIQMGERTGKLPDVLKELGETLRWEDELAAQTKKAVLYPIFLGVVVFTLVFFLMIYLVPQLTQLIESMGQTLPGYTIALIWLSDFMVEWWWLVMSVPIGLTIVVQSMVRTNERARLMLDTVTLRLWLVGPILEKLILARFTNAFGLMYKSGITVLECLEVGERLAGNRKIGNAIKQAREQVSQGGAITDSFRNSALLPPLVLSMLEAGEKSGNLGLALHNVSQYFNRNVRETIEKLQTILEPVLTLIIAVILVWVIVSVFGPIYDTISNLQY